VLESLQLDQLEALLHSFKTGEALRVIPNHVRNAVNLVDDLYLVTDGEITQSWEVGALCHNT
jgi:D-serine deaminase-like pyridoxal phosphate-dependent protein